MRTSGQLQMFCSRHMDREALSFCKNCGKYYCKECLIEGKEYYYCNLPECRAAFEKENNCNDLQVTDIIQEINPDISYVKLNILMNQADAALFRTVLEDNQIEYFTSGDSFYGHPVTFYLNQEKKTEVEKILEDFEVNLTQFSVHTIWKE